MNKITIESDEQTDRLYSVRHNFADQSEYVSMLTKALELCAGAVDDCTESIEVFD